MTDVPAPKRVLRALGIVCVMPVENNSRLPMDSRLIMLMMLTDFFWLLMSTYERKTLAPRNQPAGVFTNSAYQTYITYKMFYK